MKEVLFIILVVLGCCNIYRVHISSQSKFSDIVFGDVETLAQMESTNEKIYKYTTWHNEECLIYVGGAYAKGKKVTCTSGSDHPVCVDCQL